MQHHPGCLKIWFVDVCGNFNGEPEEKTCNGRPNFNTNPCTASIDPQFLVVLVLTESLQNILRGPIILTPATTSKMSQNHRKGALRNLLDPLVTLLVKLCLLLVTLGCLVVPGKSPGKFHPSKTNIVWWNYIHLYRLRKKILSITYIYITL